MPPPTDNQRNVPPLTDNKFKLDGFEDWDTWNIVFIARASFVWEKIDPTIPKPRRMPFLTRPVGPNRPGYRIDGTTEGRWHFKKDRDLHHMNLAEFEMEQRIIVELKTWVAETVSKRHFAVLCGAGEGIDAWYANLKLRFTVDSRIRYAVAEARFKAALKGPADPVSENIMTWVDEWQCATFGAKEEGVPLAGNLDYLWTAFAAAIHEVEELQGWLHEFKSANEEALRTNAPSMWDICNSLRRALIRDGIVKVRGLSGSS